MQKSQIALNRYRPLMAVDTEQVAADGNSLERPRVYSLRRYGASKKRLLGDASHEKNGFRD